MDVWVGRVTTKKMLNEADEGLITEEDKTGRCASLFCPMVRLDYFHYGVEEA